MGEDESNDDQPERNEKEAEESERGEE